MPLNFQNVEIRLLGPDQKAARLLRTPGTLDRAVNVIVDKGGRLDKRLGYQRVDCSEVVGVLDADAVWTHCAVSPQDELVLFGHSWVAGCVDPDALLRGDDALVQRGPSNRGQLRAIRVSQSHISQEVEDE